MAHRQNKPCLSPHRRPLYIFPPSSRFIRYNEHTRINPPNVAMESRLGCFDLSSFVCPITNAILDEPMLAEDGRTYSKHVILAWFKSRSERQLPITSPCTRKPISESLVPNADIAKSIEEYRKRRQGEQSASGKAQKWHSRQGS